MQTGAELLFFDHVKIVIFETEGAEGDLQFSGRITPVVPASGDDNVVHVSESKDDP